MFDADQNKFIDLHTWMAWSDVFTFIFSARLFADFQCETKKNNLLSSDSFVSMARAHGYPLTNRP